MDRLFHFYKQIINDESRKKYFYWGILGIIFIVGALLRWKFITLKSLWLDEVVLYWIAQGDLQSVLAQNALRNSAPPLFAVLLNLVIHFGTSERFLRFIPFVAGTLSIPFIYKLARRMISPAGALFCAFLVAIAPSQVEYSQQVREYSLTFLFAILILDAYLSFIQKPTWRQTILLALIFSVGLFLQYGLALLITSMNILFLIHLLSNHPINVQTGKKFSLNRDLLFKWVISQVFCLGAVLGVYLLALRDQFNSEGFGAYYLGEGYWEGTLNTLFPFISTNTTRILYFVFPDQFLVAFTLLVGLVAIFLRKEKQTGLLILVPALLAFCTGLLRIYPYIGARQDMFLFPGILLGIGLGFEYLFQMDKSKIAVVVLILITALTGINHTLEYLKEPSREEMRPVARRLTRDAQDTDRVYVYYGAKPAFQYYYHGTNPNITYGTSSRKQPQNYLDEITPLLEQPGPVYFVFSHCYSTECSQIKSYIKSTRTFEPILEAHGADLFLAK